MDNMAVSHRPELDWDDFLWLDQPTPTCPGVVNGALVATVLTVAQKGAPISDRGSPLPPAHRRLRRRCSGRWRSSRGGYLLLIRQYGVGEKGARVMPKTLGHDISVTNCLCKAHMQSKCHLKVCITIERKSYYKVLQRTTGVCIRSCAG